MKNNYIQIFDSKNIHTLNISSIPESQLFITIKKISGQPDRCEELLAWPSKEKDVISHFQKVIGSEVSENRYFLLQIDLDISISEFYSKFADADFVVAIDLLISSHIEGDYVELHQRFIALESVIWQLNKAQKSVDKIIGRPLIGADAISEHGLFF